MELVMILVEEVVDISVLEVVVLDVLHLAL